MSNADGPPTTEKTIRLSDGRTLAYRDHGDPGRPAVFFFHGSGSTADGIGLSERVDRRGGRLISPARPGIGGSDPDPNRSLVSWAGDVGQLADQLGLTTFAVLGFSGGGPYALATAAELADRVTAAAVLSCGGPFDAPGAMDGMARPNRLIWFLVRRAPGLVRFLFRQQARQLATDPHAPTATGTRGLQGPDRDAIGTLTEEELHRFFDQPMTEALRHGPAGLVQDMEILAAPWCFDPGLITAPVSLWHGINDTSAPVAMAQYLGRTIPHCEAHLLDDNGHLSTILDFIDDAVGWCLVR